MKNKRNGSPATLINSRVTTTISVSLVLLLLGLVILLAILVTNLSSNVKESLSFNIVLSDDIKETEVNQIIQKLEATVFVKSTEYISKEAAAKQLEADMGQNPEEFLGYNPLPGMIVVKLYSEYTDPDRFAGIEDQIKKLSPNISSFEYRKDLLDIVSNNFRKISVILLGIATLLLIISFALINNTIRLRVYADRFSIHTMKLVGATAGFIRIPFIRNQFISGIIAAFIAIALLFWGLTYISNDFPEIRELIDLNSMLIIAGSVFVLGILISLGATFLAVNKYFRMEGDDLFYI